MPLDILHCDTTGDLAKLGRGAARDARLGGVDGRRLGMGDSAEDRLSANVYNAALLALHAAAGGEE